MEVPQELERPVRELAALHRDQAAEIRRLQQDGVESARRAIAQDDELRQLLSYCKSAEAANANGDLEAAGASTAFGDVATKLAAILDGES